VRDLGITVLDSAMLRREIVYYLEIVTVLWPRARSSVGYFRGIVLSNYV